MWLLNNKAFIYLGVKYDVCLSQNTTTSVACISSYQFNPQLAVNFDCSNIINIQYEQTIKYCYIVCSVHVLVTYPCFFKCFTTNNYLRLLIICVNHNDNLSTYLYYTVIYSSGDLFKIYKSKLYYLNALVLVRYFEHCRNVLQIV